MFRFLSRRERPSVPYGDFSLINSNTQLGLFHNTLSIVRLLSSSLYVKNRPKKSEERNKRRSFTVSFFMNSCGLSPESAFSASKKVCIKNAEKADSVLRLFSNHGFTNTQISKVVRVCPQIVLLNPVRNLLPKIEFFYSIGVSRSDLSKVISSSPILLSRSLTNCLIPNYKTLKNVLVLDEKVVKVLKRYPRNFFFDIESNLAPNIAILREIGMPESRILFMVIQCAAIATCKPSNFRKIVNEVQKMGLSPLELSFVFAIQAVSMKKSIWESKINVYGRWGLSKDETLAAFRRHPRLLLISEDKITRAMDFLVNKMGWLSQDIAKRPEVLLFSLEKRIIPRCSVVQVLLSKGLIKKGSPYTWLVPSDRKFMESYVTKFQDKLPYLLNVYEGKTDLQDLRYG